MVMGMDLLREIQSVADRYADARIAYDKAVAGGDKGGQSLHWEHLLEAEAKWMGLFSRFADRYADQRFDLEVGTIVVWRRGSVGLEGRLIEITRPRGTDDTLCLVATKRGEFSEFSRNLMPLSAVEGSA